MGADTNGKQIKRCYMWFAAPSNICIKCQYIGLTWRQKDFSRIKDGAPLKIENNAQNHNTKPIAIIWAEFQPLLVFAG